MKLILKFTICVDFDFVASNSRRKREAFDLLNVKFIFFLVNFWLNQFVCIFGIDFLAGIYDTQISLHICNRLHFLKKLRDKIQDAKCYFES